MKGVEIVENKENKTASKELATKIISNSKEWIASCELWKRGKRYKVYGPFNYTIKSSKRGNGNV